MLWIVWDFLTSARTPTRGIASKLYLRLLAVIALQLSKTNCAKMVGLLFKTLQPSDKDLTKTAL